MEDSAGAGRFFQPRSDLDCDLFVTLSSEVRPAAGRIDGSRSVTRIRMCYDGGVCRLEVGVAIAEGALGRDMESNEQVDRLVCRAKEGDRAAFEDLVAIHRSRIEALVRARLGSHLRHELEVDDAIQETLLRALESIGRFTWQGDDSFMRWLGTIAENVIRSAARRLDRRRDRPLAAEVPGDGVTASRILRRGERFDRFQEALDSLDPVARRVVYLARIQGLPIRDVAREIGRTPNATSIVLYRALLKLRDAFGDTESLGLPARSLEERS